MWVGGWWVGVCVGGGGVFKFKVGNTPLVFYCKQIMVLETR